MKQDILNFIKKIHIFYIITNVLLIILTVVCLFYSTQLYIGFMICTVLLILFTVLLRYFYNLYFSMGVVYDVSVNGNTLSFKTKKQEYSYDLDGDCCRKVEVKNNKFVCTFVTESGKDVLTFYRYLPYQGYKNAQYTKDDISFFCPEDSFSKTKQKSV